ncbi:mannitol-1-phosphate 5-dehydrogenase [Aureibacillus halotolerans]|uniref:Mannitol-1-phosphate 5-dehydrogenase n=1 Tax=Aureibacillus halotolerans TaxID=1508390 RepID=A0A4R6U080_9BACI|nr:mannitol-1-phosphate 5-dehydrogenase [Aureibacillus halotolerans]TDQ37749.1 D-mannitol 1-phosphate 5-dehydrogenase [Aureibacillus halotolerans]
MKAVHFGAGNIGRGFIGALLFEAGYETTFLDVNDKLIQAINDQKQYHVALATDEKEETLVQNVSGINSASDTDAAIRAISEADLVTTAVGPNILQHIAKLLAEGLRKRYESNQQPLNIIACENMIGGSSALKEHVFTYLERAEQTVFSELYGFPDAAVDRIVPNQTHEDMLRVTVEPYFEWVVETADLKGGQPPIPGIKYVDELRPYIERKLFTVNTGHAAAAYLGYLKGYSTINEALQVKSIRAMLQGALKESGEALIRTYSFDRDEHAAYIERIIQRFENPHISDDVTRVARGPIRKLGPNDRLIRPAKLYTEATGEPAGQLAYIISAALKYNYPNDPEAMELQEQIKQHGYQKTLETIAELPASHPLTSAILNYLPA